MQTVPISIQHIEQGHVFDIIVTERSGDSYAKVRIADFHTNICLIEKNGRVLYEKPLLNELICIHSLPENWRRGYGSAMMERLLADVKEAGYETLVLWVFEKNTSAIRFYESFGFAPSGKKRPSLGAVEEMYCKALGCARKKPPWGGFSFYFFSA